MRICSFLPSATDVLYAIGLGDEVAGITYECDTPGADSKPVVVHSRLPKVEDTGEIDRMVRDNLARGESLYMVDDKLLAEIAPDLIVTMVELAGGQEMLGRSGHPSYTVSWEQVIERQPEMIIVCPCGYSLDETVVEFRSVQLPKGWDRLPVVQAGKVFAVDANYHVSRPSHHLARGVEIFAQLLHPNELGQLPGEDVAVALS